MEQWQIDAILAILGAPTNEVEPGSRVYISSQIYGSSRYHLIDKRSNGVQVEQTNVDEKWGSRVFFQNDEIPEVLKTLLSWHLADVKAKLEEPSGDEYDDLDDKPF